MYRPLKIFLIQSFSLNESYSHQRDPPEKRNRGGSVRPPKLKARNGRLGNVTEKYTVSGLDVGFGEEDQTAQLNSLFTKKGLQGMMERKN